MDSLSDALVRVLCCTSLVLSFTLFIVGIRFAGWLHSIPSLPYESQHGIRANVHLLHSFFYWIWYFPWLFILAAFCDQLLQQKIELKGVFVFHGVIFQRMVHEAI
jgi:hypothetical protein